MEKYTKFAVYSLNKSLVYKYNCMGRVLYRSRGAFTDQLYLTYEPGFQHDMQELAKAGNLFDQETLYIFSENTKLPSYGRLDICRLCMSKKDMKETLGIDADAIFMLYDDYDRLRIKYECLCSACIDYYSLYCEVYANPVFPQTVNLLLDTDQLREGKLTYFTRIITDPNVTGVTARGKIFFPDRDWVAKGIYPGKATVTIKFQKANFGILLGEQEEPKFASLTEVLDHIWNDTLSGGMLLLKVEHPALGVFYARDSSGVLDSLKAYVVRDGAEGDDNIEEINLTWPSEYTKMFTVAVKTLDEWFFDDTFGSGNNVMDKFDRLVPTAFDRNSDNWSAISRAYYSTRFDNRPHIYSISTGWREVSAAGFKSNSELLDNAVANDCFKVYLLPGYNVKTLILNCEALFLFTTFSEQEIDEIISAANCYNKVTDETIMQYCRKGKLSFETVR